MYYFENRDGNPPKIWSDSGFFADSDSAALLDSDFFSYEILWNRRKLGILAISTADLKPEINVLLVGQGSIPNKLQNLYFML